MLNRDFLAEKLSLGPLVVGQVRIKSGYALFHTGDVGRRDLEVFTDPHRAIMLARYDDEGIYRPLKTAPNLRHGWRIEVASIEEVLLTLDFLYPAAVGTANAEAHHGLHPVCLRETLGRQSGMYAVTKKITDVQAEELIRGFCHAGCLRKILWRISQDGPSPSPMSSRGAASDELPLLCAEACNLLVAEARKVVKAG